MATLIDTSALNSLHFNIESILDTSLRDWRAKQIYTDERENRHIPLCQAYLRGQCNLGTTCLLRHSRGEKDQFVCKHWLRSLCKRNELCEFLHEYDLSKMPPCHYYVTYGSCNNEDCSFLHINARHDHEDCPYYTLQGFCPEGPHCEYRHRRADICPDFLAGFCVKGPECTLSHPKWEIPPEVLASLEKATQLGLTESGDTDMQNDQMTSRGLGQQSSFQHRPRQDISQIRCNRCGQMGHFAATCPLQSQQQQGPSNFKYPPRPMNDVTCFKCGEKGHYANQCPNSKNIAGSIEAVRRGYRADQRSLPQSGGY